jgi:two-component system cell cycle sensor histidine kinase/response regulator CckA
MTLAAEYGARISLLVCDVVMPVMRGPEMVRKIREGRPDIPVLFMSGHAGRPMSQSGTLAPADHLLEKPFTANSLLQAVRGLLDSH